MQVFKSIPFHIFQDHCCERRFKHLGVPNYYDVICSLAGADQCNPRICPVWNAPAVLPVASTAVVLAHQNRPQSQRHPQSSGSQSRPPAFNQPPPRFPNNTPSNENPANESLPVSIAMPLAQSIPEPVSTPSSMPTDDIPPHEELDIESGSGEVGGSLREINLKLKEEALLAPISTTRRRPSRRRSGNR